MGKSRNYTGERIETFVFSENTIEHLHRYAIAMELVKGKKVLDIACGEGYGTQLLSQKANHVTGVDIDVSTINKAVIKYKNEKVSFTAGSIENIPFPDSDFDAVVSFETIEHIANHVKMITEIKRVLKPGGILIISTPNKKNYSDKTNYQNPYHVNELYQEELVSLISEHFKHVQVLDQQVSTSSVVGTGSENEFEIYSGNYQRINTRVKPDPVYFIAVASDSTFPPVKNSIFLGESVFENALKEKENLLRNTFTYKLGNAILFPFKLISKIFKK